MLRSLTKQGGKIRVAVIGNCQARPLAAALEKKYPEIEVCYTGIVHLLGDQDYEKFEYEINLADIVVAQRVSDNYPCEFVRTDYLMSLCNEKLLRIVNLYFTGYNPELRYIRLPGIGHLRGPLAEYHSDTVLSAWHEGLSATDTVMRLSDPDFNSEHYLQSAHESFKSLAIREQDVDIKAIDVIDSRWKSERLFFSFNHPSLSLLNAYTNRIGDALGLDPSNSVISEQSEPLGQIKLPANPVSGFVEHTPTWEGFLIEKMNGTNIELGKRCHWQPIDIVNSWFRIYDSSRNELEVSVLAA